MQQNRPGETTGATGEEDVKSAEEALRDPETFKDYEEAIGDLGDADGAASIGGPAA